MTDSPSQPGETSIARPIAIGAFALAIGIVATGALVTSIATHRASKAVSATPDRASDAETDARRATETVAQRAAVVFERSRTTAEMLAALTASAPASGDAPAARVEPAADAGFTRLTLEGTDVFALLPAPSDRLDPTHRDHAARLLDALSGPLAAAVARTEGPRAAAVGVPGVGLFATADTPASWTTALVREPAAAADWITLEQGIAFDHPLAHGDGAVAAVARVMLPSEQLADIVGSSGTALFDVDGTALTPADAGLSGLRGDLEYLTAPAGGTTRAVGKREAFLAPVAKAPFTTAVLLDTPRPRAVAVTTPIDDAQRGVFLGFAAAGLVVFLSGLGLARFVRRRLEKVGEGAAKHATGDLFHRVPADGNDEIGRIGQHLNATAARLQRTIGRLEEGERRLQSLIDHMGEGLIICDQEDRIVFANRRFSELLGMRPETLQSSYVEELLLPDSLNRYRRECEYRREGRASRYELSWFCQDGEHVRTLVAGMPLYDPSGEYSGSYGVVTDITRRENAQRHTAQEEKLRALAELAGAVAHDFNNHFTTIVGNAQYLLLEGGHPEPVREALRVIETSALASTELVRRMREFTKPRSLDPSARVANPNTLLEQALESVRLRFANLARQQGLTYHVVCETAARRPVRCHPSELREALANILANALEAMPQGGHLELAVFDRGEDAVAFRVTDEGCGIDLDDERKIFDPFFTTKDRDDETQSNGLGLSISYGIVKAHGGRIDVRSAPGQGTTFTVVLPAYERREERSEGDPADSRDEPPPQPRAVLVGAPGRRTTALHKQLQSLGLYAACMTTPESALTTLSDPAIFNTLIVEYELDGANGWEFARRARSRRPDLTILLLSDPQDELDATQAKNAGIDRVLVRPFDARDIEAEALRGIARHNLAEDLAAPSPEDVEALTEELGRHEPGAVLETWTVDGIEVVSTAPKAAQARELEEFEIDTLEAGQVEVWFEIDAVHDFPNADTQDDETFALDAGSPDDRSND